MLRVAYLSMAGAFSLAFSAAVSSTSGAAEMRSEWMKALLSAQSAVSAGVSYADFSKLVKETDVARRMYEMSIGRSADPSETARNHAFTDLLNGTLLIWRMRHDDCNLRFTRKSDALCDLLLMEHKAEDAPWQTEIADRTPRILSVMKKFAPEFVEHVQRKGAKLSTLDNGRRYLKISTMVKYLMTQIDTEADGIIRAISESQNANTLLREK